MDVGTLAGKVEDTKSIVEVVDSLLLAVATKQTGLSEAELVTRDLDPSLDMGFPAPEWKKTVSAGTVTYVDITVPDQKFIGIYGVGILGTVPVTMVEFKSGASIIDRWYIEDAELNKEFPVKIARQPVIVGQNRKLTISIYATTAGDVKLVLLGRVCEPKGKTINPPAAPTV